MEGMTKEQVRFMTDTWVWKRQSTAYKKAHKKPQWRDYAQEEKDKEPIRA